MTRTRISRFDAAALGWRSVVALARTRGRVAAFAARGLVARAAAPMPPPPPVQRKAVGRAVIAILAVGIIGSVTLLRRRPLRLAAAGDERR